MRLIGFLAAFALLWGGAAAAAPRMSTVAGAGGVPLLVAEAGDPTLPGILFIHGMAQSSLSFHRQFEDPALTARFHLVAFDLRGQGGSGKPWRPEDYGPSRLWADDVAAVIKATGLRRPLVVGWSYGGFVAMDYVRGYGIGNIAGIAMVGSLGGLVPMNPFSNGSSEAARAMKARSADQRGLDLDAFVVAGKGTGANYMAPAMTAAEGDTFFATEIMTPAYVRRAMAARPLDNHDLIGRLALPMLFMRGSEDVTMPREGLDDLLKRLPNAKLSAYDGAGHLVFMEAQARFDRELAAFATAAGAR